MVTFLGSENITLNELGRRAARELSAKLTDDERSELAKEFRNKMSASSSRLSYYSSMLEVGYHLKVFDREYIIDYYHEIENWSMRAERKAILSNHVRAVLTHIDSTTQTMCRNWYRSQVSKK